MKLYLTQQDVQKAAVKLFNRIQKEEWYLKLQQREEPSASSLQGAKTFNLYGIPRGGIPAAYLLSALIPNSRVVDNPDIADAFVDDLIDSGATLDKWVAKYPSTPFISLYNKQLEPSYKGKWLIFPWEGSSESSIQENIRRIIQFAGEDASREGLVETPNRVAKALKHWFSGYDKDPSDILKVFDDGAEQYDQMVIVKDIPIYSKCEHHMADIFGTATVAYIPDGKIVGLSKLSRLADIFARRLQVQERLTSQIADAINEHLTPKGVGVMIKARHMCMESRGICQQGHYTVTTCLRGAFLTEADTRSEFMAIARQD